MQFLNLVKLNSWPILNQLRLEEALLRTSGANWCIINQGAAPAVVMGISGKPELLICTNKASKLDLPIIRRFSGGGTVVVDQDTLFFSLICNQKALPIDPYPESILRWVAELYAPIFPNGGFSLTENDFTLHGKKFGGNAHYLCKDRWLHHTSMLWDYQDTHMDVLLIPQRQPKYRLGKSHGNFVCRLKDHMSDRNLLMAGLVKTISSHFEVIATPLEWLEGIAKRDHRKATHEVTL